MHILLPHDHLNCDTYNLTLPILFDNFPVHIYMVVIMSDICIHSILYITVNMKWLLDCTG